MKEVIVTNTIAMDNNLEKCKKLKVLSVATLLGDAIKRIHEETSVSSLFI
jgi:ribose-phosphate pyrophosphokinase